MPYDLSPFPEFPLIWIGFRLLLRVASWVHWGSPPEGHAAFVPKSPRSARAARRRLVELRRNNTLVTSEEDCDHPVASANFKQWAAAQDKKKEELFHVVKDRTGVADGKKVTFGEVNREEVLTPVLAVSGDQQEEDGWDSDDEGDDFDEDPNDGSWLTDRYLDNDTHLGRGEFGVYSMYTDEEWAEDIKLKWERVNRMVTDHLLQLLECGVRHSPDPLGTVLLLVRSCHRARPNGPHCLARHALEMYNKVWRSPAADGCPAPTLPSISTKLKWGALEVAARVTSPQVLELVVDVFELKSADVSISFIETLLAGKKFRDAATLADHLGVQSRLPTEEIVTPLFIGGQGNVAERFIAGNPVLQKRAIAALDRLLAPESDLVVQCSEMGLEKAQLQEKAIEKLVERLIKLYKFNPADFPNFVDNRNVHSVRNLLYRKYTTNAQGNWEELIEASVRGNLWLQVCLIKSLAMEYKDTAAAVHWAKTFAVPPTVIPPDVLNRVEALRDVHYLPPVDEESSYGDLACDSQSASNGCSEYFALDLPDSKITMVDDAASLRRCMQDVLRPGGVVGMDSEWRPTLCTGGHARMGLLQLATVSHAYLLDMVALPKVADRSVLLSLFSGLFTSKNIVVLGYAFDGDIEMLMNSMPGVREAILPLRRVVDIRLLSEQVDAAEGKLPVNWQRKKVNVPEVVDGFKVQRAEPSEPVPYTYKHYTSGTGLSGLIDVCFGRPLDKSQQMSDWERRPLRAQQKTYAALDAYCLVQVFDVLRRRAQQLAIEPEPCLELRNWAHARRASRLKHEQFAVSTDAEDVHGAVIRPYQLSLVADVGMTGLARHLRCCGVDMAVVPARSGGRQKVVEIARAEKRIILTSGEPYMDLRQEVPHGRVFAVPAGRTREQVVEVLRHFNVSVLPEDIFSRCQSCNGCEYRRIRSADMRCVAERLAVMLPPASVNGTATVRESETSGSSSSSAQLQHVGNGNGHSNGVATTNGHHAPANGTRQNGHGMNGDSVNGRRSDATAMARGRHTAPLPPSKVPFVSLRKGLVITTQGVAQLTDSGTVLCLDSVSPDVVDTVESFVCCCGCGKVFWEGRHSVDVRKQFQHIVNRFSPER